MVKRYLAGFLAVILLALTAGCGTLAGMGKGAAEGAKEDWQALQKADGWLRKNAW